MCSRERLLVLLEVQPTHRGGCLRRAPLVPASSGLLGGSEDLVCRVADRILGLQPELAGDTNWTNWTY